MIKIEKHQKFVNDEDVTLDDLIWALAHEIASLKEDRCQNEGYNWFQRFKNGLNKVFPLPRDREDNK